MSKANEKNTDNLEYENIKQSNEDLIAKLEAEKLRREIANLDLIWWKRPAYLALAIPVIIAVFGFFSALLSGFFSDKRDSLKAEIKTLSVQKDLLQIQIDETFRLGKVTLIDAKNIMRNLDDANRIATRKVWDIEIEENNIDSVFIGSLRELYEENLKHIDDAEDRIDQFILKLESLPISNQELK